MMIRTNLADGKRACASSTARPGVVRAAQDPDLEVRASASGSGVRGTDKIDARYRENKQRHIQIDSEEVVKIEQSSSATRAPLERQRDAPVAVAWPPKVQAGKH
jgi:hypothetical protein